MFINDITKILKGFVNCFVSVAKARFGSHGKSVQNIYVLGILSLSSSLARSCSHACFRSLTRRRCLKSICGKSKYAQCAVIHSNLRLPLLCRKKPFSIQSSLLPFLSMGQQRKQGDGGRGDCLLSSAVCRAQGYLPIETHNFGYMSPYGYPAKGACT